MYIMSMKVPGARKVAPWETACSRCDGVIRGAAARRSFVGDEAGKRSPLVRPYQVVVSRAVPP